MKDSFGTLKKNNIITEFQSGSRHQRGVVGWYNGAG